MSDARYDSVLIFSFTEDEKANAVLQVIKEQNQQHPEVFPLRAFILTVETSSY